MDKTFITWTKVQNIELMNDTLWNYDTLIHMTNDIRDNNAPDLHNENWPLDFLSKRAVIFHQNTSNRETNHQ